MKDNVISSERAIEILNKIKNVKEDELKDIIDYYKDIAERIALNYNDEVDFIGFDLDINYNRDICDLNFRKFKESEHIYQYGCMNYYSGYILNYIKICYSLFVNDFMKCFNKGQYYYINDDSYLEEFIKYIKDRNIESDCELILYVSSFIKKYFHNWNKNIDREKMYNSILKDNFMFYEPIKEHSIVDFKGKGAAMCSEYSALGQNILSLFGYDIDYIFGSLNNDDVNHVYNMININNKYYLLDFSKGTILYNYDGRIIKSLPFIAELSNFNSEMYDDFIEGDSFIELDNYETYKFGDYCLEFSTFDKRVYKLKKCERYE